MTQLALVAVLLLAFAPSINRLVSGAGAQVLAGWTELCTASGLKWVDTADASPAKKAPLAGGGMPMGTDCDYCRLVDVLPLLLLALCLTAPTGLRARLLPKPAPSRRPPTNLRGLGSQGPPLFL